MRKAHIVTTVTGDILCHVGQFMKRHGEDEYVIDPARIGDIQTLDTLPQRAARKRKAGQSVRQVFLASFYREMQRLRKAERNVAARHLV